MPLGLQNGTIREKSSKMHLFEITIYSLKYIYIYFRKSLPLQWPTLGPWWESTCQAFIQSTALMIKRNDLYRYRIHSNFGIPKRFAKHFPPFLECRGTLKLEFQTREIGAFRFWYFLAWRVCNRFLCLEWLFLHF